MKKKIILVDDEELILKSIVREFEPFCETINIEMVPFTSTTTALQFLEKESNSVFLVISDLRMPEMKGSVFLQQVHKKYPYIKLFLLTAFSDMSDIQLAVKSSINRLILKPWDYTDFENSIKETYDFFITEEENRNLKKELLFNLEVAGDFQKSLLKTPDFSKSNMSIEMQYIPVEQLKCGGDYYDYVKANEHTEIIMLGDVSGHGIKPAFVTAMLKVLCSIIRADIYYNTIDLGKILTRLNEGLFKSLGEIKDIITTYTALLIDTKNMTLRLSGAGQLPVYILRNNNLISLKMDSPAMGLIHDYQYSELEEKIEKDDLIIMFTDGLIESEKSQETVDNTRIKTLLVGLDLNNNPSKKILDYFKKLQFEDRFADDITLFTVRIL